MTRPAGTAELVEQAVARLQWQDPLPALRRLKRQRLLRTVLRDVLAAVPVGRSRTS